MFVGVWYFVGVHLYFVVWFLVCDILLGLFVFGCVVVGLWYLVRCHLPWGVWLLLCDIVLGVICIKFC